MANENVVLGDGLIIPIGHFESEEKLLDFLLERAIRKAHIKKMIELNNEIKIDRVIFSGPATIVFWRDGVKTVVKCTEGDKMDYEVGIAMCTLKKILGDSYIHYKKHVKELVHETKEAEMKKKLHGYVKEIKNVIKENKKQENPDEQET